MNNHTISTSITESAPTNTLVSDVTRVLSASVYENYDLRTKLIDLLDNPCRSVADSFGMDAEIVLKHALHAKEKNSSYYYLLFLPSFVFIISVILYYTTNISGWIPFLSFLILFSIVYIHKEKNTKFLKNNFSVNSNNVYNYVSELRYKSVRDYVSKVCKNVV